MNLPKTHFKDLSVSAYEKKEWESYTLGLEMCASQAVHMLVEVVHLESIELIRNCLDVCLLVWLLDFDTWSIPMK